MRATQDDLLTRIVGVEDAPEHVIKANQDRVRKVAVESGRHGLARGPATNGTARDNRLS
ncbi:MAG: hypothetical protein M3256_19970 [Actinomycetota bacterium]|nr:hypothetical protein [Actinomycetota bacterium]